MHSVIGESPIADSAENVAWQPTKEVIAMRASRSFHLSNAIAIASPWWEFGSIFHAVNVLYFVLTVFSATTSSLPK
jgi:hypothetical protein